MPTQVPSGQEDSYFIGRVRRDLRDQPVWFSESFPTDGVQGSVTVAGSKPWRLKRAPISNPIITLDGAAQAVVLDVTPIGTQVAFNTEQGEFYTVAPTATGHTLAVTYQASRYSDTQILEALKDGLAEMWPEIWVPVTDTSLMTSPMFTEYTLPAQFNDPRVYPTMVEVQPPSGILVSLPTGMWRIQGETTLVLLRGYPAGSVIRITYNGQYANLSDLEGQVVQLPVYYANYKILLDQESMRTRSNDLAALTGENGAAPEIAAKTAGLWLQRFQSGVQRLAVAPPVVLMVPGRSVELLESGVPFSWNP